MKRKAEVLASELEITSPEYLDFMIRKCLTGDDPFTNVELLAIAALLRQIREWKRS